MENEKWNNVLIDWVNCLKLCKSINTTDELRNGEFFSNLQKVITKSRDVQQDTLSFIFDLFAKHYPNYLFANKTEIHLSDLPEMDLKALISLLMHYTCIHDRKDVLTSPLCHRLPQSTQLIIRNFLQKIPKNVTTDTINDIIKSCIDDASDHLSNNQWLCVENVSAKNSPLQDFLKTPVSKFGRLQEKDRIISKLKSDLETERYDKADLQEELKQSVDRNKKIEQQLAQKSTEISRLRAEIAAVENCTPPHCQDMDSRELQRRLRSEIQSLEQYIKQIETEQEEIRREKETAKEQVRKIELRANMWEEKFLESERTFETLTEYSKKQNEDLKQLQEHCSELTAMLEEYRAKTDNDSSLFDTFTSSDGSKTLNETLSVEDLACSVVEVQLRDAQKLNEELKNRIGQLEEAASELRGKFEASKDLNGHLAIKMDAVSLEKKRVENRLEEVEESFAQLKVRKEELEVKIENLNKDLLDGVENLQDVRRENKELMLQIISLQTHNKDVEKQLSEVSYDWETEKQKSQRLENDLNDTKVISERLQFELADAVLENQRNISQIETLNTEFSSLLIKQQEVEAARSVLETHLIQSQAYSENLKTQLDEKQSEIGKLKEEIATNKIQMADYVARLVESDKKLEELQASNAKLVGEVSILGKHLSEALTSLNLSQNNNERLEKQLNQVQIQKEGMVNKLEGKKAYIAKLEQEKIVLMASLQQNEELRENLLKQNEQKSTQNEAILKKLDTTEIKLQQSEEEFCTLKKNSENLRRQVEELEKHLAKTQQECQILVRKNEATENKHIETVGHLSDAKKEISELEKVRISLEEQLSDSKASAVAMKYQLKQLEEENEAVVSSLETRLQQSEATCCTLKKTNENLSLQIVDIEKRLSRVQGDYEVLIKKNAKTNDELVRTVGRLDAIQKESLELEKARRSLEEQLSESRTTAEALKYLLDQLEREKQKVESSWEMTEIKLQQSEEECGSLEQKNEDLGHQVEEMEKHLTETQEEYQISLKKNEANQNELLEIVGRLSDVKKQNLELEKIRESLEQQLSDSKVSVETSKYRLKQLEEKKQKVESTLETTETKWQQSEDKCCSLEKKNEDLSLQIAEVEKCLSKVQEDCQMLMRQNEGTQNDLLDTVKRLNDAESDSLKLEKNLSDSKAAAEDLKYQIIQLEEQKQKATRALETTEIKLHQSEEKNCELKKENEDLSLQCERVQENLKMISEQVRNLEEELKQSVALAGHLEVEKQEMRDRLKEAESQIERLEKEKKNLTSKEQIWGEEIDKLELELAERTDLVNELHKVQKDLQKQLEESQIVVEILETGVEKLKQENHEISQDVSKWSESSLQTKEENEHLLRNLDNLQKKNAKLASEVADLNTCWKQATNNVKVAEDKTKQVKDILENETGALKTELEGVLAQLEVVRTDFNQVRKEKKELETKLEKLYSETNSLNENLTDLEKERENLVSKIESLKKEKCTFLSEKESLTTRISKERKSFENILSEITDNLKKKENKLTSLLEKLEKMSIENSDLEKKIEVEEIISSETKEKNKVLEETIQDYEITISGLKKVVDSNLESMEALKEELADRKNKEVQVMTFISGGDVSDDCDFKASILESFATLSASRDEEMQQKLKLEQEIEELKVKNLSADRLNSSFQEMVEKLQGLLLDQNEMVSMEALKTCFERIHSKVNNMLQQKQKLSEELEKLETEKHRLSKQLATIQTEKEEVYKTKAELETDLKEEKEKVVNLRKELENKTKPTKPEKENILSVSTKGNKSREEELKKENMMLKRKIVLTENAKNNLEKVLKDLRDEKKVKQEPTAPNSDVLYKKLLQEYIQVKEENERLAKEKKEVDEGKTSTQELQSIREAYGNVIGVNSKLELENVTLRKKIEEYNTEMSSLAHIKEAYEKLLEENNKYITEVDTLKYKRNRDKDEFVRLLKKEKEESANREIKKIQEIRNEYENKLEKMKDKMLKLYREEVNKKVKSMKDGQSETGTLMKTVANLRSELFEADQKIQLLEMEKEMLKSNRKLDDVSRAIQHASSLTSTMRCDERASTLPRPSITEEITYSRRTSIGRIPPNPHNLPMEDEEDLFNDKYLTDLKEGRCTLASDRESSTSRFSELAWRNSLVPPHLKSSYPAELQFVSPTRFKDEDIKTGNIEFEDSLCKLLPGEKPRTNKKDFGTTSYKKPGPPTPSKNGGRLSLQGNEVHPLREHYETKTPKKSTPKRMIMAMLTGRNHSTKEAHESQSSGTPSRRFNIFRRPR